MGILETAVGVYFLINLILTWLCGLNNGYDKCVVESREEGLIDNVSDNTAKFVMIAAVLLLGIPLLAVVAYMYHSKKEK